MNSRLSRVSDEKLEKNLIKLEKWNKVVNVLFIATIILNILCLIIGEVKEAIGLLILSAFLKFILYPMQIGSLKNEINRRKGVN